MGFIRRLRRIAKLVGLGLMVAAISQEMSKPEAERTWQGTIGGVVPYDFRPPTWERLRAAYWNPDDERLFVPRVLGVGWAINFARARSLMQDGMELLMGSAPALPERRAARAARPARRAKAASGR